jgi:hypothetical protein
MTSRHRHHKTTKRRDGVKYGQEHGGMHPRRLRDGLLEQKGDRNVRLWTRFLGKRLHSGTKGKANPKTGEARDLKAILGSTDVVMTALNSLTARTMILETGAEMGRNIVRRNFRPGSPR